MRRERIQELSGCKECPRVSRWGVVVCNQNIASLFLFLRLELFEFFLFNFKVMLRFLVELVEFLWLHSMGFGRVDSLAAAHLPFHELGESSIWTRAELFVAALFSDRAVVAEDDDCIGTLDGGEAMSNADSCVIATQKRGQGTVDQSLRLGIESGGGFVENQDIGVLDQRARNGNSLFLTTRQLCTAGSDMSVESIRLETLLA